MRGIVCTSAIALVLGLSGPAAAESSRETADIESILALAGQIGPAQPQSQSACWVEHTQVQPPRKPSRALANDADGGGNKVWIATAGHWGAEHWTADMQRACSQAGNGRTTAAGAR